MAYIPDSGDIVWTIFNPQAGHEQAGHRPALVLSPKAYNSKVGLAIFCPITSQVKGYPFEVLIPEGLEGKGVLPALPLPIKPTVSTTHVAQEKKWLDYVCILKYICIQEEGMPLLQVRDMPEDLYKTLAEIAKQDNRSIAQETIYLLKKALNYKESRQSRRKRILTEIHSNPIKDVEALPDPAALIREDRER